MTKKYYRKSRFNLLKIFALLVVLVGIIIGGYVFFPIFSWQLYFAPVFASQDIQAPIPKTRVISQGGLGNLIEHAGRSFATDYTNAGNWYPNIALAEAQNKKVYSISIPKIGIKEAQVTNADGDLTRQLVQFNREAIPPHNGNTIIFGHSTLPQLFNHNDYKTIFANLYKVEPGDMIEVHIDKATYNYKIQSVTVIDAEDTSVLAQNYGDSFLTIITCTPPGTTWKRLAVRAKLEKL